MTRPTRTVLAPILAAAAGAMVLVALLPAAAGAATRTVPFGFWGANWDGLITVRASAGTRAETWAKMADSGVESQRTSFFWSSAEFYRGQLDFSTTDDLVSIATANNIKLLPVVMGAPRWARQSDEPNSPPTKEGRAAYANYVRQLVRRYGPEPGTFWNTHPWLERKPIREWQFWNEPSERYQWTIPDGQDAAPGYGALLRAAYKAAKAEDPGSKVVLAGLPNYSWKYLDHLYDKGGIKGFFDRAAVHPYTTTKHGVRTIVGYFRDTLKKHGDGKLPIFVTETGLPASKGKTPHHALETTDEGMATFLRDTYNDLMGARKTLGIGRVYWYTWASSYANWYFNYTGLFKYRRDFANGRDVLTPKPAFKTYRSMALAAEGK